jgi:3-carboxy-cis,cis-muconate cycloisomerase
MSLFDPLFGSDRVAAELSDEAWVRTLVEVEVALARAAAGCGLVSARAAAQVTGVAAGLVVDVEALGAAAVGGGNPVIPLVRLLRAAAGDAGPAVHVGATSQDVLDTALVLLVRRASAVLAEDLAGAADAAALHARVHRDTPMAARTLGQQALPTTFGLVAAGWCAGLDHARAALSGVVDGLPVQLGGAAGTLAALHPDGLDVGRALAAELGLPWAPPWHTERTRVGALAGALGVAAGACAKPATDVVLLAGTELGEVSEAAPGDSSSMPHKHNPIAAVTARAAARRAPGLVATLLASMEHEHQRAAGAWHAEWPTVTELLRVTGGAASRLRTSLEGLQVHPATMATHVPAGDLVHHAGELVDHVLDTRQETA